MLSIWSSLYHNHSKSPSKSSSKAAKNKKSKNESNAKVAVKSSKRSYSLLFKSCIVIVISMIAFYFLPWEKYVFTEDELVELLTAYDSEYLNFMATNEEHFKETYLREYPCVERGYWREKQLNITLPRCGTLVVDEFLPSDQISELQSLTNKLLNIFGDTSYTNRESINLQWLNFHNLFRRNVYRKVLTKSDYQLLKNASISAKRIVSETFGLPPQHLHFTMVTQMTRYRPFVKFQEFRHVDKVRSVACIVTSILWLSTHNHDFSGGLLEFLNGPGPEPYTPIYIEPKLGRFAAWTSGYESPHGVSEVYWGSRVAIIFAFTVNPKLGYHTLDDLRKYSANVNNSLHY